MLSIGDGGKVLKTRKAFLCIIYRSESALGTLPLPSCRHQRVAQKDTFTAPDLLQPEQRIHRFTSYSPMPAESSENTSSPSAGATKPWIKAEVSDDRSNVQLFPWTSITTHSDLKGLVDCGKLQERCNTEIGANANKKTLHSLVREKKHMDTEDLLSKHVHKFLRSFIDKEGKTGLWDALVTSQENDSNQELQSQPVSKTNDTDPWHRKDWETPH